MRIALFLLLIAFSVEAQIKTSKLGDVDGSAVAGVSVAISPKNNKNVVAYAGGKVYSSNDGGATWSASALQMPDGIKGTPNVICDSKGNFVLVYSTINQIVCHNSTDNGKSWGEAIPVTAAAGRDQYDPGVVAHPKKEELIVTWTQSGKIGSEADTCKSNIMMSTSGNGGKKWSKPIVVNQNAGNCLDEDFTVRGSSPMIGQDNKMFVVWAGHGSMFFDRSYNGTMWISTDLVANDQVGGWTLNVPGFGKMANPPSAAVDNSPSRTQGTLFLAYSDLKSGDNDGDIWLLRSVNRGDNWTSAARINQDKPGREQFLPHLAVDPANGIVYILFYDRRDHTDNQTDVYLAWSVDGGNQFKEMKITEKPFVADMNAGDYMSDYLDLSVHKGLIVPAWTVIQNGKQELWTAAIRQEDLK